MKLNVDSGGDYEKNNNFLMNVKPKSIELYCIVLYCGVVVSVYV